MAKQVAELLGDLFQYFTAIPRCTLADVKYYCFQLTDKIKAIMTFYFDQVKQYAAPSSVQNVQNSLFSLQEIQDYYTQLFTNIAEMLKTESVYATDDVVEKIKTYVKRNYKNDITVEYLSSLFYMNRSYCSHLFREKTGEKFVDYMNKVRIEKAKQLLLVSDKKMYQIAKAVGYDNVKYFFRIFNKFEGMTPEQFRREKSG
jgi:two-component system response regulator YesN